MGYPTTVDTGQPQPVILQSLGLEAAVATGSGVLTANIVYLIAVTLTAGVSVSGMRWRVTATATGTTDLGLYDASGNLLVHTGAITNVASTTMTSNFSSNYALSPGNYYLALCPSNSTDTYGTTASLSTPGAVSDLRQATNAGTSGVLPSTTGVIAAPTTRFPLFCGVVVGGLP
jgi:hypothetical protein